MDADPRARRLSDAPLTTGTYTLPEPCLPAVALAKAGTLNDWLPHRSRVSGGVGNT
jgi:hypothetical protein